MTDDTGDSRNERRAGDDRSRLDLFADAMASVLDTCVWSQTMTHETLVPYLIEESYELVEAIEAGTTDEIIEELGDVLWQVAFHSEVASRTAGEEFDIEDVAQRVTEKMVRRHPHVFGDEVADTPEEVLRLWTAAKAAEKTTRRSVLDGIPRSMPALALADKVLGRAARLGVAPPPAELSERAQRDEGPAVWHDEGGLGALLLSIVASAREHGLDAERALRVAVRELEDEVRAAELSSSDHD
ncbi:MazG family protein [Rathayibacter sp. CAU 1779]